eukprot:Nk52_evm23s207 gene=Nk52_evmTU23s207
MEGNRETNATNSVLNCFHNSLSSLDLKRNHLFYPLLLTYGVLIIYNAFAYIHRWIRRKAWEDSRQNTTSSYSPGFFYTKCYAEGNRSQKFTFVGEGVGWNWQGIHRAISHWPGYVYLLAHTLFFSLPVMLGFTLYNRVVGNAWCAPVSDALVCRLVMESMLCLDAEVEYDEMVKGDVLVMFVDPKLKLYKYNYVEEGTPVYNLFKKGLIMRIWASKRVILSAKTCEDGKDVDDFLDNSGCVISSRNALLLALFNELLRNVAHVKVHVLSEMCAREISSKRLTLLEPSSRFTVSLNEGVLHSPVSPGRGNHPLTCTNIERMVKGAYEQPNPPAHVLDKRKLSEVPFLAKLVKIRSCLFGLVRKYRLDVDTEALFNTMFVHRLDHYAVYVVLTSFCGGVSIDGSGSLASLWRMFVFGYFWNTPIPSLFENEYLSNESNPFYKNLYEKVYTVDKKLADLIVTGCSF